MVAMLISAENPEIKVDGLLLLLWTDLVDLVDHFVASQETFDKLTADGHKLCKNHSAA